MPVSRAPVWFQNFHATIFVLYVIALATTMSGMEIFSSLLGLCLVMEWWWRRPQRNSWVLPPFLVPFLALIAVAMVGVLLGPAKAADKFYDFGRMRLFLLYGISFYELLFFRSKRLWLKTLFFTSVVLALYGCCQHFYPLDIVRWGTKKIVLWAIPEKLEGPLVIGFFNHHLTFANVFTFYGSLFTALGLSSNRWRRWFLTAGALIFLAVVWTQSRAAWVAIPAMALTIAVAKSKKWMALFLGIGVVLLGVLYVTDVGFHERFERTFLKRDDFYNLGPRRRLWNAQIEIFKENPILGFGWNNNERHCKEYVDRLYPDIKDNFCGHAHSNELQILATTGIVGAAAFLWLWWTIMVFTYRAIRAYRKVEDEHWILIGCFAAFVGFHLQGITQWNFGDAKVLHNLMFFLAVVSVLGLRRNVASSTASLFSSRARSA